MAKQLLANWQGAEIALVMDRTDLNDRWSLLTVGIATDHQLMPRQLEPALAVLWGMKA